MSGLLELADRVEAAAGADRELDVAIHVIIGNCHHQMGVKRVEVEPGEYDLITQCRLCGAVTGYAPKNYTKSLDAALTLVPEGHNFSVDRIHDRCGAVVNRTVLTKAAKIGSAVTPALALVAAALRARHALTEGTSNE